MHKPFPHPHPPLAEKVDDKFPVVVTSFEIFLADIRNFLVRNRLGRGLVNLREGGHLGAGGRI